MRFRISKIAFVVALIAAVLLQVAPAGAQMAQQIERNRAERLKPIIEWVEKERRSASILGDVAEALGIGTGEEVATVAKIYRYPSGLQYSFHLVRDHPEIIILIRSDSDVADSWKIFRTGIIERSVHVDEQDKVYLFKFQRGLFEETLRFFEASVKEVSDEAAAKNESTAAVVPAVTPPAVSAAPQVPPPAASIAPAGNVADLITRGTEYNLDSDYDRAIADFNEAIRLDSNSAAAFYGRAAVYYNMGDYDRAIQDYDQVLRIDPKNDMAITFRALAYERKNQR